MKEAVRIRLLKLLALLAVNIFIYSAVVVLRSIIFMDDGGMRSIALYAAVLLAGILISRLLQDENHTAYKKIAGIPAVKMLMFTFDITEKTRFIASAAIYASMLLPVLAALLLYGREGVLRAAFEIIITLLPYLVSVKNRYSGFSKIMSNGSNTAGFIILAAAVEISVLSARAVHLKPYLFIGAYIYILIFLILRNQEDIDENIYDRKNIEKSILPRNMRSFNTLAVVVLFSAILILFNLKSAVLWLMAMAGKIAVLLAGLLLWLAGLIFPDAEGSDLQDMQPLDFGFFGAGGAETHPFYNFIFNIFKYFILLYLVYRLLFFLLRRIPAIAGKIAGLLGKLFSWSRDDGRRVPRDYDDESEIVKPPKESDVRRALRTMFKNAGRDLKTITDPVERIRFIYASLLEMLGIYGIPTEKSDTTLDILRKALVISGMEKPLCEVTDVYNGVRYGGRVPGTETLLDTEARYREAAELMKRRGDTPLPGRD